MSQLAVSLSSGMFLNFKARGNPIRMTANEDVVLLNRFIEGDDSAFIELFDRHHHRLYLYCLKLVGTAAQAEDLMQEVWERVIKLRLNPQHIQNPGGFFATIARNLCLNHLKMQRRRSVLNTFIDEPTYVEPNASLSDLEELVHRSLEKLPLEYREVLVLNIYCDYDYGEIAEMLGKNVTAIRMRASRARAQLRKIIEQAVTQQNGAATRVALEEYIAAEEAL